MAKNSRQQDANIISVSRTIFRASNWRKTSTKLKQEALEVLSNLYQFAIFKLKLTTIIPS